MHLVGSCRHTTRMRLEPETGKSVQSHPKDSLYADIAQADAFSVQISNGTCGKTWLKTRSLTKIQRPSWRRTSWSLIAKRICWCCVNCCHRPSLGHTSGSADNVSALTKGRQAWQQALTLAEALNVQAKIQEVVCRLLLGGEKRRQSSAQVSLLAPP